MFAGRLLEIKGIKTMISAFNAVNNPNFELHICGDGELKEYVVNEAKKNSYIKYCGKLNKEELNQKYNECDILIVPSEWPEPFGRVLIEANYYGMPVIANNVGGMPEIIENTNAGIVYEGSNIDNLKKAIESFGTREVLKDYIKNIKENIGKYDIQVQKEKFMKIYSNIIKK